MQKILNKSQLNKFYSEGNCTPNVDNFFSMISLEDFNKSTDLILDIGGGSGLFAKTVTSISGFKVICADNNIDSINRVKERNVSAIYMDALAPIINEDYKIITFNMIIHHLVAHNLKETDKMQYNAVSCWISDLSRVVYISDYCYESYFANISTKLIYLITSNWLLSSIANIISYFIPSLRANTLFTGVKFKSLDEWTSFLNNLGRSYEISEYKNETVPFLYRLLLIKKISILGIAIR